MDLRRTGSVTLSDISRSTGISLSHVSRIMSGRRQPSVESASKLSAYLGLPIEEFMHMIDVAGGANIPERLLA